MQDTQESQNAQDPSLIEQLKTQLEGYISDPSLLIDIATNVLLALLLFWVGRRVTQMVSNLIRRSLEKSGQQVILVNFISNIVYYTLLVVVVIMSLAQLGIQTTSMLAVFGAAGLAIGLALKDSLSNFASGVMLVMFRPFKIGHFVEVAGVSGKVKDLRIFSTILLTTDNKEVIIPNGQVTSDVITNYTSQGTRRVDLVFGVSYDDDLKVAKRIMEETVNAHPLVMKEPAPKVALVELGASSVDFAVRPWTTVDDYWTVYSDLLEQMKANLEAGGCSFPYPQSDVHLHQVNKD
ncbi:mechanosensitive ion channel family protein [Marinicella rhabdoformis]|uniref:mechanosensitive ion channel family protein n=1 Tax=Marinicella rhabdoformis TaxID=2580566 RepID=UPI0012AEBC53|nr:mechanosensitive ion channel domain-containing protein [Marinicella rhabdoformis]